MMHNLIQGSPEWVTFRLNHHGASEAAAMLGLSKKVTRSELLHIKHTGIAKEFCAWVQKNILAHGHEVENLARPIIEKIIGEELYPVTCSISNLSASCDGLTMDDEIAFEHKQWNKELAASVKSGIVPDEHMPQCQQIMLVTGAKAVMFTVSDGTEENFVWTKVHPDKSWFDRIKAGWAQFDKDLLDYVPPVEQVEAAGRAPDMLPALRIELSGTVTASNLTEFKEHALAVFSSINTELETDEDFANAEKTTKWCKEVEDRLEATKQHALSQIASIDELFRTVDAIKEEARQKRLTLEKLVKQRKEAIRDKMVLDARARFIEHVADLQHGISIIRLSINQPDFGGEIKGLKALNSIQNALDTALANAKIDADAQAKDILEKIEYFNEIVLDHKAGFFPDLQQIISKPFNDFARTITSRLDGHLKAEAARLESERERIRQEEIAKLEVQKAVPSPAPVIDGHPHEVELFKAGPNSPTTLKLGAINERLGFTVSADFLKNL